MKMQEHELEIQRLQKELKKYARENGVYPNFGAKEIDALKKKYVRMYSADIGLSIYFFEQWCAEYEQKHTIK